MFVCKSLCVRGCVCLRVRGYGCVGVCVGVCVWGCRCVCGCVCVFAESCTLEIVCGCQQEAARKRLFVCVCL